MVAGLTRKSLKMIHDDCEYYPHQITGIRQMAKMSNFLLADEMGLGKSLQALTVAAIDFELGMADRVLIVAPASLKWNWLDEIAKFTYFSAMVLNGTQTERDKQLNEFISTNTQVLVINYEQVKPHLDSLNRMGFNIAIYDEAHYIKNYKAARTKACLALNCERHFLLTGSPLLNQVNELWPLLHRIDPVTYHDYRRFVNRYAIFGGWKDKQIVGTKHKEELSIAVAQVMIRRLKKDVLGLPDKQYIVEKLDLHPLQLTLYKQAADELQITVPDNPSPMDLENALTKYLRLKQICNTAAEIEGYEDISTKLDRLEDIVQEVCVSKADNPAEPLVVFTQFRTTQACIVSRLQAQGHQTFILNGDVKPEVRSEVVKQWGDYVGHGGKKAVLVAMLQVAGVGLNMTQANKCVFIDRLYVPKLNEQAEDRLHRIGADLTKPIQIWILVCRNTIEQRIQTILNQKKKLFDSIVEDNDWKRALFAALTEDEDDE
jgi:SNF2 family DNA or RNA helicase